MVNFKAGVLFIRILTSFILRRTFGNVIYDIVQNYSELATWKLHKLKKLSMKLKKADLDITFYETVKFLMLYRFLLRLIYQMQIMVNQDLSGNDYYRVG